MKRRDLRIMFNTNAPHSSSGYSIEMRDILYRLVADGWLVSISAFYGVDGGPTDIAYPDNLNQRLKGLVIRHFPRMNEGFGSDAMYYHSNNWQAHAVFSMQDIWTLDASFLSKIPRWIPWFPVDKDPLPMNIIEKLTLAYKIMCFSKFGYGLLSKAGFASTFITEGTDVDIFQPRNQQQTRKEMGVPNDMFLFSLVGANKENPPRKGFQESLQAFKLFYDKHPEAGLLVHIQQRSPMGFPIKEYAQYLGILPRVIFMNDYLAMYMSTSDMMAKEYNCCDAILHPSQTEGFGLCIIEAQACGKPAIVQDCQSMPEIIIEGKTGFAAKTLYKRFTSDSSFVHVADPQSIYECMEKTYQLIKTDREKVQKDCREWVVNNFNIDLLVKEKWIPFLENLQNELLPLTEKKDSDTVKPLG